MRTAGILLVLALAAGALRAEPYLAMRSGLSCSSCHVNRTGGGGRTAYGAGFGATTLPARPEPALFDGALGERVRAGADFRAAYVGRFPDPGKYLGEYRTREANLYLTLDLLPERLTLYFDEHVAPGGASGREAFALVAARKGGLYAKAGRFFLPYGLRLLDDDAATRRFTGFTFESGDQGIEVGGVARGLSWAVAATNGNGGASEIDNGKQFTASVSWVRPGWRAGASVSTNDRAGPEKRNVGGLWGGFRSGPVVGLAAVDVLRDTASDGGRRRGTVGHGELDCTLLEGVTVRAWTGRFDPDGRVSGDDRRQIGAGIDWTPAPGLQLRLWGRRRGAPADVPGGRDDELAAEVHVYF